MNKNKRMFYQSIGALVLSLALGFIAIQSSTQNKTGHRMPQSSVLEIFKFLSQIEVELKDQKIFNPQTAAEYIKKITEAAYSLQTKDIYPNNEIEKNEFAKNRQDWISRLFQIQLTLRTKLLQFQSESASPLPEELIAAFRNANLYLSYAQDFVLMEWATTQDLAAHQKMFSADFPVNLKNPLYASFELEPGDIFLVRGNSFISATIARSGDFVTNYSHVAMVVQDPEGQLFVAEALMEKALTLYKLDEYLNLERLSRAMVVRPRDSSIGQAAALEGYKIVDQDFKSPVRKVFDILMDPNKHDRIYCLEFVKMAYEAIHVNIPAFPMTFKKAMAGNSFYRGMGNNVVIGASPDDVFYQPEFEVVMVQRDISKIKADWAFDIAVSAIFEFIHNRYDYQRNLKNETLAKVALFLKDQLKIKIPGVPSGLPAETVALILQHKIISTELQTELMKAMNADSRPLAYKELEDLAKNWLEKNQDRYFIPCVQKNGSANSCAKNRGG